MIKIANQCHYYKSLARELIERIQSFQCAGDFTLNINDEHISLCGDLHGQQACFTHALTDARLLQRARQKNQALLKACNNKKRDIIDVVDLTAGWGKDSLMLASHGQHIVMLEQNLLIYQCMHYLLQIARDAHPQDFYQRMSIIHHNSLDFMRGKDKGFADCLYLDPMFPAHKSSAKPSKDLQILQRLTNNIEIEALFEQALDKAGARVVVKRPLHAATLNDCKPDMVYKEKTIRFDVYLTR